MTSWLADPILGAMMLGLLMLGGMRLGETRLGDAKPGDHCDLGVGLRRYSGGGEKGGDW